MIKNINEKINKKTLKISDSNHNLDIKWKYLYDDNLNPSQNYISNLTTGQILVLAGAGTGKTKMVVHRVKNIINNG